MGKIKNNFALIILTILVLSIIFFVVVQLLFGSKNKSVNPPVVTPTPIPTEIPLIPTQPEEYKGIKQVETKETKATTEQQLKVTQLISKLPYSEDSFSFDFDFQNARFILTLDKNNLGIGNKNFIDFLKQNGIEDPLWIKNMVTQYK